jgi:hypothetical protein
LLGQWGILLNRWHGAGLHQHSAGDTNQHYRDTGHGRWIGGGIEKYPKLAREWG